MEIIKFKKVYLTLRGNSTHSVITLGVCNKKGEILNGGYVLDILSSTGTVWRSSGVNQSFGICIDGEEKRIDISYKNAYR